MAGSSWSGFVKTVLVPMLIALSFYVVVFLVALPLYRRHRSQIARYANYAPISSSLSQHTTSIFEPYLIEPSKTLLQRLKGAFVSAVTWAWERQHASGSGRGRDNSISLDDEDDGGLFDAESGEAMVGFNAIQNNRGRGRIRAHFSGGNEGNVDNSNRRLSRELEEGFRDDSGSEDSDTEVTVGRRTVSRRGSEVRR